MDPIFYAIPVVVVIAIVLLTMPVMKKKAKEAAMAMDSIRNLKIHLTMAAGGLNSVNGETAINFTKAGAIYGIDSDGDMDIEFTPCFIHAGTTYKATSPMHIHFAAEAGKSYEMTAVPKEPADKTNVLDISPIVSKEIIFKSTFYIVTKDITDTPGARVMRGIM